MNPMPEWVPRLKQLRLSGMLDSLEQRNRQALEQQLAYTELLAVWIQDELARRDPKQLQWRLRRARVRSPKPLEQFDYDCNPGVNRALLQDVAPGRFIRETVAVLIVGPCGTGKSHLAQALGHGAVQQGYAVRFTTQSQLLGSLQAARATGTSERRFQTRARVPLLILDDFGRKPLRPPPEEDFHDLGAERYEQTATILTSNLDFSEGGDAFPNRLLGAATRDRLRHGAYRLLLEGQSYRAPKPLPEAISDSGTTPTHRPIKGKVVKS